VRLRRSKIEDEFEDEDDNKKEQRALPYMSGWNKEDRSRNAFDVSQRIATPAPSAETFLRGSI
jgi:hypothetical protein